MKLVDKYLVKNWIAEKYIEQLEGKLMGYKVHCFMREPKYI